MSDKLNSFGLGARFVSANELSDDQLGPLKGFVGEWESIVINDPAGGTIPSGWNVISVPGVKPSFIFEVIPYKEDLKFSTVAVQAGNRGPIINGQQIDQDIFGLFYEQQIKSVCDTDFCNQRGFSNGTTIHAETGLLLYISNQNGGFNIARLGTIPHGNAVLALGASSVQSEPVTIEFPNESAKPTNIDGSRVAGLDYDQQITRFQQFKEFNQVIPDTFLKSTLESIGGKITDMTTLTMNTNRPNATGGILNIPFVETNVKATTMDAVFWLETIEGGSETELLQYTQTINLVFPATGTVTPIVWPHITINTLKRKTPILKAIAEKVLSLESVSDVLHIADSGSGGVPQL